MSIIDPLTCGFAKVITYTYLTTNHTKNKNPVREKNVKGKIIQEKYESLQRVFGTHYFDINYTTFRNKYPKIINHIHEIGKKNPEIKRHLLEVFSEKKWNLLSDNAKSQHQIQNCDGCLKSSLKIELGKFPIKSVNLKKKAQKAGLFKEKILHDVTNKTLDDLNKQFKNKYNTKFTTQVKKIIYPDKMLDKENIIRAAKHNIEQQWKETSVER